MDIRKKIYYNSPIFLQNLFCSLYGLNIIFNRYNDTFKNYLRESFELYFLTAKEIKKKQNNQLKLLLNLAYKSPFWKERFNKYNIDISKSDLINEIKKLPILTKKEVKENIDKILIENNYLKSFTNYKLRKCSTSGTTGSGLTFLETGESEAMRWAIWWRYRYLIGLKESTWCAFFGGRNVVSPKIKEPPFWRVNYPCKQVLFSTYHISEQTSIFYLRELKKRKFEWIHGYPSSLSLIAYYALKFKIDLGSNLQIVTTGAENLLDHQRILMEKAFNVPIMNHYGQAEGVANFSQINKDGYLVDEDYSIVEFIKTDHKNKYKVIGTSLYNLAFPLIRYDTQDIVDIKESNIDLETKWRQVENIDGRLEDYLVLNDGAKIGRLDHIFKDLVEVVEAQFVQIDKGKADLLIVTSPEFNDITLNKLKNLIHEKLGKRIEIKIIEVKRIEKSKSGKLRMVKSKYKI